MGFLVRIAEALGRLTARLVPSAFAIAVLLSLFIFVLGLTWGGGTLPQVLNGWAGGFWELLAFSMQMALVLFSGYLLALTNPVRRVLQRVARLATSPRGAVVLMALMSMLLAYINWGLSLVASALLVRFIAKERPDVDYRLLVACAYFGLGATWHAGISASAPLLVAAPGHFLEAKIGVVPTDRTLFSGFNLALVFASIALLSFLAWALHPKPEQTVKVDPKLLDKVGEFSEPEAPKEKSVASFFDHSPWLNTLFGAAGLLWLCCYLAWLALPPEVRGMLWTAWREGDFGTVGKLSYFTALPAFFYRGWKYININLVNFLFLTLAVLLHRTPARLLKASEEAGSVLHGVVLQFPLYAGMYGMFKVTGLTEKIGELFVRFSSAETFPTVVYVYSGIVNYFVPSGGSKWAIEAPYLLDAAARLHVPPEKVVLAYAWGDMATDLIQPFWALPLLAVAKLEFKDILGFLLVAFFIYVPLVTAAFFFFG